MASTWGKSIKLSIFGESHSKSIGIVLDGLPSGEYINMDEVLKFMARRRSQGGNLDTPRIEEDLPDIQSGMIDGYTCGTPLAAVIKNSNTRSSDYSILKEIARPSHADYTGYIRYNGYNDIRGGGHFSGRLTAPLVFAGAVCKQILARRGILIGAHIKSIADISDESINAININSATINELNNKSFPTLNESAGEAMKAKIEAVKKDNDSIGGVIECAVIGVGAGLGSPMFDGVENSIASIIFGIPAVKGLEFGLGFKLTKMTGSQANDPFISDGNAISTSSNNNGGILGGITNSMPIIFSVAIKPTASISRTQKTVNFVTRENTTIEVHGRHDPCIVRRAVPCVESAAAIAITDLILGQYGVN